MKKNILVFGAAGFIGTYLIDELIKQNYNVVASDISKIGEEYYNEKGIPYISVDLTNSLEFDKLEKLQYDAVIHLAAAQPANISLEKYDPKNYINVNVNGTLNILEFCKKNKAKKIIYATSHRNTQGLWENNKSISENDGRSVKYTGQYSMFSISETAAQDCVLHYQAEYGLQGIILRLPPVYGYGPHTEIYMDGKQIKTGFQIFIENAIACKPLEVWGDSDKGRDIVYIKDVVVAFIKSINNNKAKGLFNITSGKSLTLWDEANIIAKTFWGDSTPPVIVKRPDKKNHIDAFLYNINKAKKQLNWEPKYNFENMLIDYISEEKKQKFKFLVEKRKEMFQK